MSLLYLMCHLVKFLICNQQCLHFFGDNSVEVSPCNTKNVKIPVHAMKANRESTEV